MANWFRQGANGGNMSDFTRWFTLPAGGVAMAQWNPTAEDVFYANGKSGIVIDVSFSCLKISTVPENGAGVAGGFLYNGQNASAVLITQPITITGDIDAGVSHTLSVSGASVTSANRLTVNGECRAGNGGNAIYCTAANADIVVGNCLAESVQAIHNSGASAHILVNGNVSGSFFAAGIINYGNTSVSIRVTGNVTSGEYVGIENFGHNTTIQIDGDCIGQDGVSYLGLYSDGMGCDFIFNNVFAGLGDGCNGATILNASSVIVNGDVTGGSMAIGLNLLDCNNMHAYGTITGGLDVDSPAIYAMGLNYLTIHGNAIDSLYCNAVIGPARFSQSSDNYHLRYDDNDVAVKYVMQLDADEVKKHIQHGDLVGTLAPASPFRRINKRYGLMVCHLPY